jgi:hypothetical protein
LRKRVEAKVVERRWEHRYYDKPTVIAFAGVELMLWAGCVFAALLMGLIGDHGAAAVSCGFAVWSLWYFYLDIRVLEQRKREEQGEDD